MRWVVGLLLASAGILKAAQLIAEPVAILASPLGWFLAPLQISAELIVGALALSGAYWRRLRWLALLLFVGFAAYSLYLAINGAASCGCFGPIEIHPWWTFGLDVAVVAGLLAAIFAGSAKTASPIGPRCQVGWATTLVALTVGCASALNWYALGSSSIESLAADSDLVVLEPEEWIGKPLPIADYIDADLSEGDWIVLLHRHDCPECQEVAPRYEGLASTRNIALIEMPPYGGEPEGQGPALHARMPDDREWFVQTPVEIRVKDGVVLHASTELPAIVVTTEL
jgi:hypothetical protein